MKREDSIRSRLPCHCLFRVRLAPERDARSVAALSVRTPRSNRGFTLLELLVVIVIIGLLAAYVGPRLFGQVGKSEQGLARSQIEAFSRALGAFRLDIGRFPTNDEGLAALNSAPPGSAKWNGPYLDKSVPLDPWGKAYLYRTPASDGRDFEITSLGKDGLPGGTGEAADISNR